MTWLAGETITAARLSQDSDSTTLTNDAAVATSTFEDWGTETVTFSDPGVAVKVKAWHVGKAFNNTDASTTFRVRVGISFDGGSTFDFGQDALLNVGTGSGMVQRVEASTTHFREGTPTGDIVVKTQLWTDDTSTSFQNGTLMAEIVPQ